MVESVYVYCVCVCLCVYVCCICSMCYARAVCWLCALKRTRCVCVLCVFDTLRVYSGYSMHAACGRHHQASSVTGRGTMLGRGSLLLPGTLSTLSLSRHFQANLLGEITTGIKGERPLDRAVPHGTLPFMSELDFASGDTSLKIPSPKGHRQHD